MFLPLSCLIGWRFSRTRRRSAMAKFISLSSCLGIALGVAVLIIGLSAMNGFESELKHRVLGVIPNAELSAAIPPLNDVSALTKIALADENVKAVAPVVVLNAILSHEAVFKGVSIRGVEPKSASSVTAADEFIEGDGLGELSADSKARNIILGSQIAEKLQVKVGDNIELISANVEPNGAMKAPVGRMFRVGGILKIGGQIDNLLAFIHIDAAREIAGLAPDSANLIELKVNDLFLAQAQAYEAARAIAAKAGTALYVRSWVSTMGHLYRDIQMIRSILYLALVLIVTVACFNIISNLIMITNEKRSEVAILQSMGAGRLTIFNSFVSLGIISGTLGVGAGVVVGVLASTYLTQIVGALQLVLGFELLNSHNYFINYVPSVVQFKDVVLVAAVALGISLIASSLPSLFVNRISPAQELSGK